MSLENVKAFYQRLETDKAFQVQVKVAKSKLECSQIVQAVGYFFTQEEFEEYTPQLLELTTAENSLKDLDEKELEAVVGEVKSVIGITGTIAIAHYGVVWTLDDIVWTKTGF